MGGSKLSCAKCCTVFSISGIVFLVIMGALIQSQPLYIRGIEDSEKAAQGCYEGALLYLATLLLSAAYWIYSSVCKQPEPTSQFVYGSLKSSTSTSLSVNNAILEGLTAQQHEEEPAGIEPFEEKLGELKDQ